MKDELRNVESVCKKVVEPECREDDGPICERIVVERIGESIVRIHFSNCAFRMPSFGIFWDFADRLQEESVGSISIWKDEEQYHRGIICVERNLTYPFSDVGLEDVVRTIQNFVEEFAVSYDE